MRWRDTRDPYRILVSEIMLQQTQVERVRPKYDAFVKRFPTVDSLAKAPLSEVLRAWSGLGYNRRAKYLHECAKRVVLEYGGRFPREMETLRGLPGIGLSTAAALRAFAFGEDDPMIDTNVRRILLRVFFRRRTPTDRELFHFAQTLIPKGKGRAWNYAMLDLGATRCKARDHSGECPLNDLHGPVRDAPRMRSKVRFEDSDRYVRGRIVAHLSSRGSSKKEVLARTLGIPDVRVSRSLRGLLRDGLLRERSGTYALPR